jgi:hypothetical protein
VEAGLTDEDEVPEVAEVAAVPEPIKGGRFPFVADFVAEVG